MVTNARQRFMVVGGNFYGRGAEAMMLTVRNAVRQAMPQAVLCATPDHGGQAAAYREQGFVPIIRRKALKPVRALNKLGRIIGFLPGGRVEPESVPPEGIVNPYRASDAVIDIAGFASGDTWGARRAFARWQQFRMARLAGNRYVFMPQSWGPFEDKWTARFTRWIVTKADLVCARGQISYDYLMGLGGLNPDKIIVSPDIAFQFAPSQPEAGGRVLEQQGFDTSGAPIVGITPNMRIYERTKGEGSDNAYVRLLAEAMQRLLDSTDCRIALIPHEVYDSRPDDRTICQILSANVGGKRRVRSLSGLETAADLKAAIGRMAFLIASRYHSLVAARRGYA